MLKSDLRKKIVCSKSVTKTLYGNKVLLSEYIFKLVKVADDQSFVAYVKNKLLEVYWR